MRSGLPRRHYLDHASTSPARPEAVEAMTSWLTGEGSADPGRVHTEGKMARAAIEEARAQVAGLLAVRPRQVIFTSGATEAANSAIWGAVRRTPNGAVFCSEVEHSCVRDPSRRLAEVVELPVDGAGRIDLEFLDDLLAKQAGDGSAGGPALVHCQAANHEVGTIQPATAVTRRCKEAGVLCHVDAAAAAGHVPCDLSTLGADLVSVSAHKMGGPPGIGALVVGPGLRIEPFLLGGDQERARRAGMENTPAIVGFGAVAGMLASDGTLVAEMERARAQTGRVLEEAPGLPGVRIYGDPDNRLPHIVCLGVDGVEAEAVLLALDQAGIAAHSGSACSSETLEPSTVLKAMGVDAERSLRLSVGWNTDDEDIDALINALPRVIQSLRRLRG